MAGPPLTSASRLRKRRHILCSVAMHLGAMRNRAGEWNLQNQQAHSTLAAAQLPSTKTPLHGVTCGDQTSQSPQPTFFASRPTVRSRRIHQTNRCSSAYQVPLWSFLPSCREVADNQHKYDTDCKPYDAKLGPNRILQLVLTKHFVKGITLGCS